MAIPPVQAAPIPARDPAQDDIDSALCFARMGELEHAMRIMTQVQDKFPGNALAERTIMQILEGRLPPVAAQVQQVAQNAPVLAPPNRQAAPAPYPNYAAAPPPQNVGAPLQRGMPPMPLPGMVPPRPGGLIHVQRQARPAPLHVLPLPQPADLVQIDAHAMHHNGQNGVNPPPAPPNPLLQAMLPTAVDQAVQSAAAPKRKRKAPLKKKEPEPNTPEFSPEIENYWRQRLQQLDVEHKQASTALNAEIKTVRDEISAVGGKPARAPVRKKVEMPQPQLQVPAAKKPKVEIQEKKDDVESSAESE